MSRWQKQEFHHDPDNGVYGDCYRTCLAGLLHMDRDDVPHFVTTMEPDDWESVVQSKYDKWLAKRGVQELAIPVHGDGVGLTEILNFHKSRSPFPSLAMLTGYSKSECNHVVIISEGGIVHDPALNDSGIVGPCDDGFYWLTWLIPLESTIAPIPESKQKKEESDE